MATYYIAQVADDTHIALRDWNGTGTAILTENIIDTDGTYQKHTNQYIITQKNERLMDDIIDLVRSLGFACYQYKVEKSCTYKGEVKTDDYYRTQIYGGGLNEIPSYFGASGFGFCG